MSIFKKIAKSWDNFKTEIGYTGQKFFSVAESRETSSKSSPDKTTYDRYDPAHGLHDEPNKPA